MKHIKEQVIASTNPNSVKPITKSELVKLFAQFPDPYIFNQGHDESLLPAGKGYNKKLKDLSNGELAITMDVDLYDESLVIPVGGFSLSSTHKTITDGSNREPSLKVLYDEEILGKSFGFRISDCSDNDICMHACSLVNREAGIVVITVIVFATTAILRGFLEETGKESFKKLKELLIEGGQELQNKSGAAPS